MKTDLVWYACYGSNIDEERFRCYIEGGQPSGATKNYSGCKNKTLPLESKPLSINREVYFAKSSPTWSNGGVAFLKNVPHSSSKTLGKMYLIEKGQFIDVLKQEINRTEVNVDFDSAICSESYVFADKSWYGRIIYLGASEGFPIFTFTNEKDLSSNKPSREYIKTIASGLKKAYKISSEELGQYFIDKVGIKGHYTQPELQEVFNSIG